MTPRLLSILAVVWALSAASELRGETVEVKQGSELGSGYAFRRGDSCVVLTAKHVVPNEVAPVTVTSRSGAKRSGLRSEAYDVDLALVELNGEAGPSCVARWPDPGWMATAKFSSKVLFEVVRHDTSGRESIITLRYAGGTANSLTLAPVDKATLIQSDSGSVVQQEGRMVGIVSSVDPATQYAEVLRFDVIDKLVGARFGRGATLGAVQVDGVFQRGRPNANWSAYLRSWVTEAAGRPVSASHDPAARCKIAVDVLEWRSAQVPNPDQGQASNQNCALLGILNKSLRTECEAQQRNARRGVPRTLAGYTMSLEVKLTPHNGGVVTKLANGTVTTRTGQRARSVDEEFEAIESVMAPVALELLGSGICE